MLHALWHMAERLAFHKVQFQLINGEPKFSAKALDARLCPVLASVRIIRRYERLQKCLWGLYKQGCLTIKVNYDRIAIGSGGCLWRGRDCRGVTATYSSFTSYLRWRFVSRKKGILESFIKAKLCRRSDTSCIIYAIYTAVSTAARG